MRQIAKIILLLFVSGFILSCDYTSVKKSSENLKGENENLKERISSLEQAEQKRGKEEEYKLYLASIKKYAVVVTKYNSLISTIGGPQYKAKTHVSRIIEVPSNMTKDDEYKIMDKYALSLSTSMYYGYKGDVLLDKKLYVFDTYSEASDFKTREEVKNN